MLSQILKEIDRNNGSISMAQLSQTLDIHPATLDGMIQTLIGMGKLRVDSFTIDSCAPASCTSCSTNSPCPLVVSLPKTYSIVK
jgi:predicted aldo/keto reductase-like oxidoreductase